MDMTQTEYHIHRGARTTTHQEHGSSLAEEVSVVSQRQDRNRSLKCILRKENVQVVFKRQAQIHILTILFKIIHII